MNEEMKNPLISVILPVYNVEQYLPACMDSLFRQTYHNLEIILVDDGSNQECAALCDQYVAEDDRVKVIHKENGGLSDARNCGIKQSSGEYISLIDPDDTVDEDYIAYLLGLIRKYNTPMSICQHRVVFPHHTKDYGSDRDSEVLTTETCIERMLYHDVIDTTACAKIYHRSLFEHIEYPVGRIFEDIGTTYKLMIESETIAIGYRSKYNYIQHPKSIVNSSFSMSKLDLLEMTDSMGEDVLKHYPNLRDAVLRRRVYARFSTLNQMIDADNVEPKRKGIIQFIKKHSADVMKNPKTPKRDKWAIRLLTIGYPVYQMVWKMIR